MWKTLLIVFFSSSLFAAPRLKNFDVTFDNYHAKLRIKKNQKEFKVVFDDAFSNQIVHISKCNSLAWNNLVAELNTETNDYELLLNTKPSPKSVEDVKLNLNGTNLQVSRNSSLGSWSRKIQSRWEDFVSETEQRCHR